MRKPDFAGSGRQSRPRHRRAAAEGVVGNCPRKPATWPPTDPPMELPMLVISETMSSAVRLVR